MYISEKDFNNLKVTYAELLQSVSYLEEYLQNLGKCLDNIKRDSREEIKEEGSWDCTMCNDCTCYQKVDFDKIDEEYKKILQTMIDGSKKI